MPKLGFKLGCAIVVNLWWFLEDKFTDVGEVQATEDSMISLTCFRPIYLGTETIGCRKDLLP